MAAIDTTLEPLPKFSDDPAAYRKAWIKRKRKANPVFAQQQIDAARKWQRDNPLRYTHGRYVKSARNRGLEWALADDVFESLVTAACGYCGVAADPLNGVDRIDSAQGYTPENVVTACAQCNYAKRDKSVDEFLAWVDRISAFRGTR